MRPALRPSAVPSRSLLRFLRFQSKEVPFFSPSHGPACAFSLHSKALDSPSPRAASRRFSTSRPRRCEVALQASVWDFEAIIPKSLRNGRSISELRLLNAPGRSRTVSTDPETSHEARHKKKTWQERLWGPIAARNRSLGKNLEDLDGGVDSLRDESSIFNKRKIKTAKAALEPRVQCTELDENGKVIMMNTEFKKSELTAKYGLMTRDLRKIDSSNLPHMLVRPSAILLNLLHLKVLIKHDRVLLFDAVGADTSYPQSSFIYDLQGKLSQKQSPGTGGGLPYEFRALEACLMSVTTELENGWIQIQEPVITILSDLEQDIDREKLRILLSLSKRLSTFEQKAKLVRDAIEELLEADDDLSQMYLTEKTRDITRAEDDHTEVEMLLESYHKICDEVVQEASNLVSSIRTTEEIVRAILDANRNTLMLLDLKFSVYTLGLAMGTFLAGLYGMNLENFIENTNWGFAGVTGVSTFFSVVVCWYCLVKLRKVQRVRMQDPHWYYDAGPGAMLDARNRAQLRKIKLMKERQEPKVIRGVFSRWFFR